MNKEIMLLIVTLSTVLSSYCNIPKECQVIDITQRQLPTNEKYLKCLLNDESRLRFNESLVKVNENGCTVLKNEEIRELIVRPVNEGSLKLKKGMLDLNNFAEYVKTFHHVGLVFGFFVGFELNLFHDDMTIDSFMSFDSMTNISCTYCKFDFYKDDKLLRSCQDFMEATSSTKNPKSIFQFFTNLFNFALALYLPETRTKICPLAFKNFEIGLLRVFGENSFYCRKRLSFSSEKFADLNSKIPNIEVSVNNVDLDFEFLHPSVFESLTQLFINVKINKIEPNLFATLNNVTDIYLTLDYMRSLMHTNGIEWIKNMNRDVNCDLSNKSQINEYILSNRVKFIHHDGENRPISPSLRDVFPDEDFCLYRDFPINQLVIIYKTDDVYIHRKPSRRKEFGCTYLWITRSYKDLVDMFINDTELTEIMVSLLDSDEYKSMTSRCNFDEKLRLCNKSNYEFERREISTFFELGLEMYTIEVVLNILSLVLSIFGLVTNSLIIITISSKINKADFKEFKQYDYLRLNAICNCFILFIHMTSWLNQCIYPYQVFCPLIRKTVFMQYFKIVVQDVLLTSLRFMNNFTYVGFAFNRISLIGKDHNKLVRFICEISIKKFIAISLFISVGLSVIKFFEYDINRQVSATLSYPMSYEYSISDEDSNLPNVLFSILNFISDILNHFVFLLVNLAIDIGMVVKLRQTLNERLENVKEYSTMAQQEKKKTENENVLDNAISMVILNTSLNLVLKLPTSLYSLIYLWYSIYRQYKIDSVWENRLLERFFKRVCVDAYFCDMLLQLSDFLYLICISMQFFFYKHYDKKLNSAIKKRFSSKKKVVQMGLFSYFNLINIVTSPYIADIEIDDRKKEKQKASVLVN